MIFLRFFFCDFSQVFCSFFEVNKSLDDESQSVWLSTGHVPVGTDTASITFFLYIISIDVRVNLYQPFLFEQ